MIKAINHERLEKISREVKILQLLSGGPNIIKLCDLIQKDEEDFLGEKTFSRCIVYDYLIDSEQIDNQLYQNINDFDARLYLYKILEALEFCHSKGIMHRDVKPKNIIINHKLKELRLIDYGLAEYYIPKTEYNVRVSTGPYKGPELLVKDKLYHYSLDIWSLGCVMFEMIFKGDLLFAAKDFDDIIIK